MRAQRGTLEAFLVTCGTSRMSPARGSGVPVGAWLTSRPDKDRIAKIVRQIDELGRIKGLSHHDSARHASAAAEVMRSIRLEETPRTRSRCRPPKSHQHPRHGSSIVAGSRLRTIASTASGLKRGSPVSSSHRHGLRSRIATTAIRFVCPPIGLNPQPLKEKYMHVTAARPARRKVIGTWLAYWRIFPLVLAANAFMATLAWMFVGLLMK
jgi:hypothetical protein